MTLGEKLRKARLDQGLTQAQVAGTRITRNMLSQLESGTASPSVKTLEYLAAVLGVSVGWLLEDQSGPREVLEQARGLFWAGAYRDCAALLRDGSERGEEGELLLVRSALRWAEQALEQGALDEAEEAAALAADRCPGSLYAGPQELAEASLVLALCALARGTDASPWVAELEKQSADLGLEERRHLLLARHALAQHQLQTAERELWSVPNLTPEAKGEYLLLRGALEVCKERYRDALLYLRQAEQAMGPSPVKRKELYALMEQCCRELEDYKQAYACAAKRLELAGEG